MKPDPPIPWDALKESPTLSRLPISRLVAALACFGATAGCGVITAWMVFDRDELVEPATGPILGLTAFGLLALLAGLAVLRRPPQA